MTKTPFIIVALLVLVIVAWKVAYPSGTWRYKMTVTVETPEGIKTGSAVREVLAYRSPRILPDAHGGHVQLTYGEAVVVDLGSRGVLFALLNGAKLYVDYAHSLPFYVFSSEYGGLTAAGIRRFRTLKAGPIDLETEWYPIFVHFKHIDDRKSVEAVLEMEPCTNPQISIRNDYSRCIKKDSFAESFGEGVRLKSVTLEMTNEPITRGIVDKYLPWLEPWRAEVGKRPHYPRHKGDWEGAKDPEFAQMAVAALKREGLR